MRLNFLEVNFFFRKMVVMSSLMSQGGHHGAEVRVGGPEIVFKTIKKSNDKKKP